MATKELTPKQTQVKHLIDGGLTAAQVAKRMKITVSGVNNHVRKIKAAGFEVGVAKVSAPVIPAEPEGQVPPSNNGHHEDGEVEMLIRNKISEGKGRLDQIEDRVREIDDEVHNLRAEQNGIHAQQDKYAKALEDLA